MTRKVKVVDVEQPNVLFDVELDEKTGTIKSWKKKKIMKRCVRALTRIMP